MVEPEPIDPRQMNDRDLVAAYVMAEDDPDDPRTTALLEEIRQRGLDI